jgi:hypothetical protein
VVQNQSKGLAPSPWHLQQQYSLQPLLKSFLALIGEVTSQVEV